MLPIRPLAALLFAAASSLAAAIPTSAQGSPGPLSSPSVRMTRLSASVRIVDGVATTSLHQVLHNDGRGVAEAVWLLPLPEGAVADGFTMTVGGVEMTGEVLDAGRARQVYENIVRSRRDPGLLEYMGRGCLRARIFPIPPGGDVEVDVVFRQILPSLGGLQRWSFALDAAGLDGSPPEEVVLDLSIRSRTPLRNVLSPTPGVHVVSVDDHEALASFEGRAADLPDRDLAVFYGLSVEEFGLDLLSYRAREAEEGSFLMLLSPKRQWEDQQVLKKEITFVLDTSGSMRGRKIDQAKGALELFVSSLHPEDRFNVVPFSTAAEPFFRAPVKASQASIELARHKIRRIEAEGGTNIRGALLSALPEAVERDGHVPLVVFLTDGLPTVGEKDHGRILAAVRERNRAEARFFVMGVGDDVNTHLLDHLAADSRGTRDYVRVNEDIEERASALLAKIEKPVMTDLELQVDGIELSRVVPERLPDLFAGERLSVLGRYRGTGQRAIRLSGTVRGERRTYVYEGSFASEPVADRDFVPSLWAQRRVGVLLDAIRLYGTEGELLDEVKHLGQRYNIVTPYTSHLILEEGLVAAGGGPGPGSPASPGSRPGARGHGGTYRGPADAVPPGGGGGGGAAGGPATPGPAAPGAPAAAGAPGAAAPDLDAIAVRLRDAGVLPADASPEELRELAGQIARELRSSEESLRGLGHEVSGSGAVDDSVYLARLVARGTSSGGSQTGGGDFFLGSGDPDSKRSIDLLALFTRAVGDKVFVLRSGVWTDRDYDEEKMAERVRAIEAYSTEFFELLREAPELARYLALSDRIRVVLGELVIEIRPPAPVEDEAPEVTPEGGGEQGA